MSDNKKVTLGGHEVDVYAQRHAYLTNRLQGFFQELMVSNLDVKDAASIINLLGDRTYDLLITVLPQYGKRCPRYEFAGYCSQEAHEAEDYDEKADQSPTFPEMVHAFEVAAEVNRFDVVKILGKAFDPKLLKNWVNSQLAEAILNESLTLPAAKDGAEASMSSGTTAPTTTANGDSRSSDSSIYKQPTTDEESPSSVI